MDRKSFRYFICGLLIMALFMTALPVYADGSGGTTTAYDRIVSAITGNNPNTNLSNINAQLAAMNTKLENIASTVDESSSTPPGIFSIIASGYLSTNKITATQCCLVKLVNISSSGLYISLNNTNPSTSNYDIGTFIHSGDYCFRIASTNIANSNLHKERFFAGLTTFEPNSYYTDTALVLLEPGDYLKFSNAEGTSPGIYYIIYSLE